MSWLLNPFRSGTRGGRSASAHPGAAPAAPAAAPPAAPAAAGTAVAAARPQPSRATNAWASLPPLHVLHGPPTLVDWRFESQLTSWQHPMFGLKPLGHLRSPNAPGGMVVIEALTPPPADGAPAAAARPAPAAEAVELPLPVPVPAPVAEVPRAPALASDVDEWGFPLADADPTFVQSLVEGPRDSLAYYPRFEPAPASAADQPAEGALRAVGMPEQAFFDGLRPRLEPIAPPVEEPRDAAPPAPPPAPELPLAAPPPVAPPAPQLPAEPPRMRVRFGELPTPDAEPAPEVGDSVAPPPVTGDRPPAAPATEPLAEAAEPEQPIVDAEAVAPATAMEPLSTADLPLDVDTLEPVAPVLAESEPLVPGIEGGADEAPPVGATLLGEGSLDLAVRPPTIPEVEHPPVSAYFPPSPEDLAAEPESPQVPIADAVVQVDAGTAEAALPLQPPRAVHEAAPEPGPPAVTSLVPPPAPPEVLPLIAERQAPASVGEPAVVEPPAHAAPAGGELPLAPPGPVPGLPPLVAPPISRGESFDRAATAPPPALPPVLAAPVRSDLTAPAPAAEVPPPALSSIAPPLPVAPPVPRPAPDLPLAQPSRRDGGPGRERAGEAAPGAPAPAEPAAPPAAPPGPAEPLRATAAPPPETTAKPEMPLAAGRPAAPVAPKAPPAGEEGPAARAPGEGPIVGEHPLTVSTPVTGATPEGPQGGAAPETPMPLARSVAPTAATAATLVREQVSVAPLLGERALPLQSHGASEGRGPRDGAVPPLPEPAISVRAGRASDTAARQLQARAFTHEGEVHLSSASLAQGPREVEALVAHEMTHVLQQRILGPGRLPVESTSDGAALEAEARAVEQSVRSTGQFRLPQSSPVAMDLARYGTLMPWVQAAPAPQGLPVPQVVPPLDLTPAPFALPPLTLPSLPAPAPPAPAEAPAPPVAPPAAAAPPAVEVQEGPTYHWEAPWAQVQRAPDDEGSGSSGGGGTQTATAPDAKELINQMDPVDMAGLAEELYPYIETRLRSALRRHRDRAGRVTDMDL